MPKSEIIKDITPKLEGLSEPWEVLLAKIGRDNPERTSAMKQLKFDRYDRGHLFLRAPSNWMRDWTDLNMAGSIHDVCAIIDPSIVRVVIVA